ncbi:MAG: hypothetical protein AMK71_13300, partial [Nitrospira bacterium SG8_35_4]
MTNAAGSDHPLKNDEHKIFIEDLYKRLDASEQGLSTEEAARRQRQFGFNVLDEKEKQSLVIWFGKHLVNFFALLLWTGSILAFISESLVPGEGNLYIGIALAGVVILNAIFTFIQEYQSEQIMESFRKMMPSKINVVRDGKRQEVLAGEVVPGDLVYLEEGDKIPADGRLIEENSLKVDHSALTGESEPQLRKLVATHENILESRNMVFSGTLVQSGNGTAVIFGTGMNTQLGKIARLTKETGAVDSPLKKELNRFIRIISIIALTLGITFFAVSFLTGNRLMASLIFAIGIIVANVPEGLLPTVTLCLSMASKRMAKRMALIKNLDSVETLGSTTVICTDKTGTITENRISVNTIFMNGEEFNASEVTVREYPGMEMLLTISVLCNNSRPGDKGNYIGDPTEGALMLYAKDRIDMDAIYRGNPRVHEHPFDSKTKRMITENRTADGISSYMKGAPEVVIENCSSILMNNEVVALTDRMKEQAAEAYRVMASRGDRVLAMAYRDGDGSGEHGFVYVALVGMIDPPRKEIPEAVAKCRTAGISVVMITGDYSLTAEAISRK